MPYNAAAEHAKLVAKYDTQSTQLVLNMRETILEDWASTHWNCTHLSACESVLTQRQVPLPYVARLEEDDDED